MNSTEERLLSYDELPPGEQAELDAHLAAHPEARALLEEGRALRAVLEKAGPASPVPSASELAHYVVSRHLGPSPAPRELAELAGRVEQAAEANAELRAELAALEARLEALTAGAAGPAEHFARLTGRRLGPLAARRAPRPPARRAPSRGPRPLLRRVSLRRLALAATLLAGFLYGGLYAASELSRGPAERLAALDAVPRQFEGLRLRGSDEHEDPVAERYAAALDAVHEARSAVLGLFPRYDAEELNRAVGYLVEVTQIEPAGSALGLEAWYLIGRIRLYQGEVGQAREALLRVVEQEGPSARDAQRLLDELGEAASAWRA